MRGTTMVFTAMFLFGSVAQAGVTEVSLKLPVRAKMKVSGDEKVGIAPFLVVETDAEAKKDRGARVDVQGEFSRFLKKQMEKSTKLSTTVISGARLPKGDFKELAANRDFWRDLGRSSGADYIVSGVIDFDVEDKAGYRTEEYVSPVDGRTYYRQMLVETTGFVFDIIFAVFDADTGEVLFQENFRDFKEFDQRNYDEVLGLFENLRSLETRLLGLFVGQETTATRYLFTE